MCDDPHIISNRLLTQEFCRLPKFVPHYQKEVSSLACTCLEDSSAIVKVEPELRALYFTVVLLNFILNKSL